MEHICNSIRKSNDLYHLDDIRQFGDKWIFHHQLKANEKWVIDGEARYVGEVLSDARLTINFCPYCGEKLTVDVPISTNALHKGNAQNQHPQCPEIEAYNHYLFQSGIKEIWLITKETDEEWWTLGRYLPATIEMVRAEEADYAGELCFQSGFGILFYPFCGELLDEDQL